MHKKETPQDYYFADIEKYPQLPPEEQNQLIEQVRANWRFLNRYVFEHVDAPALLREEYDEIRRSESTHNPKNEQHLRNAELAALRGDSDIAGWELAQIDFPQSSVLRVYKRLKFNPYLRDVLASVFEHTIEARNKVVNCNLKLVLKFARKYQNYGLPLDDIIQEGNTGLMHAIDKYDASMGVKFTTYAVWWIRKRFMNAIKTTNKLIRIPTHSQEALTRILRRQDSLAEELGREPTLSELAATEDMTEEQLEHLFNISADPLSLDSMIASSEDTEKYLKDLIPDPDVDLEEDLDAHKMKFNLAIAVDTLSEAEHNTIMLRYGLFGHPPHTLEEIAQVIGKSREYVRQVEEAAFEKIRNKMPHLRDFVAGGDDE
jgi:RNA polymerase primary sigma factor